MPRETKTKKKKKYRPSEISLDGLQVEQDNHISKSGKWKVDDIAKIGTKGVQILEKTPTPSPGYTTPSGTPTPETPLSENITWESLIILNKLGSGASASVKRVKHKKTNKIYAMKHVVVDKNEVKPKVIVSEFKALYESKCQSIVEMYDAFYREGSIFLILEYMNCGSLDDVLGTVGKIPESVLSKIASQILKGLDYLHKKKGIVHRDIKPANILLCTKGYCKLADFGMCGQKNVTTSNSGGYFETFQGTYTYMSPERIKGKKHSYDSDLWAIGLTIAQCAIGKYPFELKENTIWEVLTQIEANSIVDKLEGCSEELKKFVLDCMKLNSKERPSAAALLNYEFISKHKKTKPSIGRWLHEGYVKIKREKKKEKVEKLK